MTTTSRRGFLRKAGGTITAATILPLTAFGTARKPVKLIPAGPDVPADEHYWQLVKDQFNIAPGYIMMNAANLCPSPRSVSQAVAQETDILDHDVSFQHRNRYGDQYNEVVAGLAAFLGTTADQLTITRNTSEGNNIVVNGLDLGKGDEVLIWDQNHPSNNFAWKERGRRMGFSVKEVTVPVNPASPDELVASFVNAFTTRTRLVAFSQISNVSGIRLPVESIVRAAREKNILTLIDGAQSFGCVRVELDRTGCDFYTASTHKWFTGPREAGILFVRKDQIARLWPNMVTAGYDSLEPGDIQRLSVFGQRDPSVYAGIIKALEFHNHIGVDRIEERVYALVARLRREISRQVPEAQFITPDRIESSAGVLICSIPGVNPGDMFGNLYSEYHIAAAPTGGIRLCPHIYNTMDEMDTVASAVASLA